MKTLEVVLNDDMCDKLLVIANHRGRELETDDDAESIISELLWQAIELDYDLIEANKTLD